MDANTFILSKSQKKVLTRFNKFLNGEYGPEKEEDKDEEMKEKKEE